MAITFAPEPRMVLMCDFDTGFKPPEMVKKRAVVVVSPRRHNVATCLVVPISSTEPTELESFHVRVCDESLPARLRGVDHWAKCDMLSTVALWRLDRFRDGRECDRRVYRSHYMTQADWIELRKALLIVLGMGDLRQYLGGPAAA